MKERDWMCTACGYHIDSSAPVDAGADAVPVEGDLTKCLNCGRVHVRRGRCWQPISSGELDALPAETRGLLDRAEAARRRVIHRDLAKRGGTA